MRRFAIDKVAKKAINQHAWGLAMRAYESYRLRLTAAVEEGVADARTLSHMWPVDEWPELRMADAGDAEIPF